MGKKEKTENIQRQKDKMYKLIAIAGTFDHLHRGHRYFLAEAFKRGERVIVGVTSDRFVSKFKILNSKFEFKLKISNFKLRKQELEKILEELGLLDRVEIVKIDNLYGPAVDPKSRIEALVVTRETIKGGEEVNRKRRELGLEPLDLVIVDMVPAEDRKRISSSRIREGEINREGKIYQFEIRNLKFEKIDDRIRNELKKPQGVLIKGDPEDLEKIGSELKERIKKLRPVMLITVGDEVTLLANKMDLNPQLMIFDFKVNRREKYRRIEELGINSPVIPTEGIPSGIPEWRDLPRSVSRKIPRLAFDKLWLARDDIIIRDITNPAGYITKDLVEGIYRSLKEIRGGLKERVLVKIIGEDDLAAVPAILLAPLGSIVLYGQPHFVPPSGTSRGKPSGGVVVVEVSEEVKKRIYNLLASRG